MKQNWSDVPQMSVYKKRTSPVLMVFHDPVPLAVVEVLQFVHGQAVTVAVDVLFMSHTCTTEISDVRNFSHQQIAIIFLLAVL